MNINISKEIKKMLIDRDLTQSQLADMLNTSQSNFANKMKRNNFRVSEMIEIAELLNYELKIEFIKWKM